MVSAPRWQWLDFSVCVWSGLDGSPKPSFEALRGLIKGEWCLPPTPMTTDADGRLRFNGFLGGYEVSAGEESATFRLERKGVAEVEVRLSE
jgi:hypothetical protein